MKPRLALRLAFGGTIIAAAGVVGLQLLHRWIHPTVIGSIGLSIMALAMISCGFFWHALATLHPKDINTNAKGVELHGERRVDLHSFHPEQLAAIGWLAGNVGQELRNPLSSVMNALFYIKEVLKGSDLEKNDPALRDFLALAETELRGVINIISDLLSFSRGIQVNREPADVHALLDEMKGIVDLPENISVDRTYDPNVPKLMLDKRKIRQVFANLAENAARSMPNGGIIRIRTHLDSSFCVIEFGDAGHGLDSRSLAKINKPYLGSKEKGLGLGIEICQRVVAAHGGRIRAESELGKGSKYYVELPFNIPNIGDGSSYHGR